MLSLEIDSIENIGYYNTSLTVFPLILKLSTEQSVMIAEKIDLRDLYIRKIDQSQEEIGFSNRISGLPHRTFELNIKNPRFLVYDVLQADPELKLESGVYEAYARIQVYEEISDGTFKQISLEAKKEIEVEESF